MKRVFFKTIATSLLLLNIFHIHAQTVASESTTSDGIDYSVGTYEYAEPLASADVDQVLVLDDIDISAFKIIYISEINGTTNYTLEVRQQVIIADIPEGIYLVQLMNKDHEVIDYKRITINRS